MENRDNVPLIITPDEPEEPLSRELADVTNGEARERQRYLEEESGDEYELIPDDGNAQKHRNSQRSRTGSQRGAKKRTNSSSTWTGLKHQPSPAPNPHLIPLRHGQPRQSYYQSTARASEYQQTAGELQEQYEKEGFRMITPDLGVGYQGGEGDIIDGKFSGSYAYPDADGFVPIEAIGGGSDLSTTKALDTCTKFVINPYNMFLKVIGWRKFQSKQADTQPMTKRVCNVIYPTIIFVILVTTCILQTVCCFSRSRAAGPNNYSNETSNNSSLDCREGIFYKMILSDILILIGYLLALYVFRYGNPEYLSALVQKVFLSYTTRLVKHSQRRLVMILLTYLVLGGVWVLFSTCLSILRFLCLYGTHRDVVILWGKTTIQPDVTIGFAIAAMLGFLFFDLLYVAVVINYCTQCQLAIYFTNSIKEKVQNKAYLLGDAVKEIYNTREIIKVLNGQLSYVMTFILFVFLQNMITSYITIMRLEEGGPANIILGFFNVLQWSVASLVPIVQAVRLTSTFHSMKKLGLEIAARPYYYSDTPQLVLDSFLNYTNATNYRAKLMFIPMKSEIVLGVCFFVLLILSLDLSFTKLKYSELYWL